MRNSYIRAPKMVKRMATGMLWISFGYATWPSITNCDVFHILRDWSGCRANSSVRWRPAYLIPSFAVISSSCCRPGISTRSINCSCKHPLGQMYTTNLHTAFKEKMKRSPDLRSLEMAKIVHPPLNITLGLLTSSPETKRRSSGPNSPGGLHILE